MDPLQCSPENIWEYAQNKPSLIIKDLKRLAQVPETITARILMARGVYKWLSVRRDLIKLKNKWKTEIKEILGDITNKTIQRGTKEYYMSLGRLQALEQCRKEVRELCHSERWRAPDFDQKSMEYFTTLREQ